jgi:hypothetical protein
MNSREEIDFGLSPDLDGLPEDSNTWRWQCSTRTLGV